MTALLTEALADLRRDEGFSDQPYRCSSGRLTIGYGTEIESISRDEAEWLLAHRAAGIWAEVEAAKPFVATLPAPARRALINMAYNLGAPRLLDFTRMWAALARGDWEAAASEALDSRWARQVGDRADRIAALLRAAAP